MDNLNLLGFTEATNPAQHILSTYSITSLNEVEFALHDSIVGETENFQLSLWLRVLRTCCGGEIRTLMFVPSAQEITQEEAEDLGFLQWDGDSELESCTQVGRVTFETKQDLYKTCAKLPETLKHQFLCSLLSSLSADEIASDPHEYNPDNLQRTTYYFLDGKTIPCTLTSSIEPADSTLCLEIGTERIELLEPHSLSDQQVKEWLGRHIARAFPQFANDDMTISTTNFITQVVQELKEFYSILNK